MSDRERAIFWRNRVLTLFDHVPLPSAFCEADGTIRVVNPAMATEWGTLPGRLTGRNALELFRPRTGTPFDPVAEAVRLRRRSRMVIEVSWTSGSGAERQGELIVDVVSDLPDAPPNLLLMLRVLDQPAAPQAPAPDERPQVSAVEARILALTAGGSTTAQIATALGLTPTGSITTSGPCPNAGERRTGQHWWPAHTPQESSHREPGRPPPTTAAHRPDCPGGGEGWSR